MTRNSIAKAVGFLDKASASRKELSSSLGISLSSAGNIAAKLISLGIASEYDGKHDAQSKSCGMLYLRRDPIFAVTDITSKTVTTHIFGHSLSITDTYKFDIDDPLFLDDCLYTYFRGLSAKCPKLRCLSIVSNGDPKDGRFYGSGIPRFDDLPIRDMAMEFLGDIQVTLENRFQWIPGARDGVCIVISDDNGILNTAVLYDGSVLSRKSATGLLGRTELSGSRSFNSAVKYSNTADEYTDAIAHYVYTVITLIDAERIYFVSDRYSDLDFVQISVTEKLMLKYNLPISDIPNIVSVDPKNTFSNKDLLKRLRDCYIQSIV